jgi:hypothetical protein
MKWSMGDARWQQEATSSAAHAQGQTLFAGDCTRESDITSTAMTTMTTWQALSACPPAA